MCCTYKGVKLVGSVCRVECIHTQTNPPTLRLRDTYRCISKQTCTEITLVRCWIGKDAPQVKINRGSSFTAAPVQLRQRPPPGAISPRPSPASAGCASPRIKFSPVKIPSAAGSNLQRSAARKARQWPTWSTMVQEGGWAGFLHGCRLHPCHTSPSIAIAIITCIPASSPFLIPICFLSTSSASISVPSLALHTAAAAAPLPTPHSPLPSRPPQPSQSLFRRRGSRQPPPLTVPRTGEDAERRRTGAAHPSSWCRGGFSAQPRPLPAACAPTLRAGVRPAASPRRRPALPGRGLRQAPPRHRRCYRRRSAARPQPWQRRGGGGAGPPAGSGAAAAPVVPERPRTSGGARKRGSPEGGGRPSGEGSSGRRRDAPLPAGEGSASSAGGAWTFPPNGRKPFQRSEQSAGPAQRPRTFTVRLPLTCHINPRWTQ